MHNNADSRDTHSTSPPYLSFFLAAVAKKSREKTFMDVCKTLDKHADTEEKLLSKRSKGFYITSVGCVGGVRRNFCMDISISSTRGITVEYVLSVEEEQGKGE
jgi:hypothetical protein